MKITSPVWCRWLAHLPFTQVTRVRVPVRELPFCNYLCTFVLVVVTHTHTHTHQVYSSNNKIWTNTSPYSYLLRNFSYNQYYSSSSATLNYKHYKYLHYFFSIWLPHCSLSLTNKLATTHPLISYIVFVANSSTFYENIEIHNGDNCVVAALDMVLSNSIWLTGKTELFHFCQSDAIWKKAHPQRNHFSRKSANCQSYTSVRIVLKCILRLLASTQNRTKIYSKWRKKSDTFLRLPSTQPHSHSIPHQFHIIFTKENICVSQENWTQPLQHTITQSTLLIS